MDRLIACQRQISSIGDKNIEILKYLGKIRNNGGDFMYILFNFGDLIRWIFGL